MEQTSTSTSTSPSDAARLGRHVPPLALEWVVDEPDRRWKRVEGTMVFADISGFTALSERLAARGRIGTEELVETLNRVFSGMLDVAESHGGQLLKFGGDALLLLFPGSDHVTHAASAAIDMRRWLRRASAVPTSVGRMNLSVSIGIHTGRFHLFLVGGDHRSLVVLGPDTTTAVGCENAAVGGEILVSPATAAHLRASSLATRDDHLFVLRRRTALVGPLPPPLVAPHALDAMAARSLMPPMLIDLLEQGRPDPIHRIATMAFFKFSGTDQLLTRDGPDAVASMLDETLRIAAAAFAEEDVALLCVDVDADGGKLFCSSGVPLTSEDDEGRMLRAAHRIVAAEPPLPLRIGINCGHVFASELGTDRQAAFSAMSDTVNTAARIMTTAPPGVVHAHPAVLERARARYAVRSVGPFQFKGKAQPQTLYVVGEELGPRMIGERAELPLIGRDAELAVLTDAIATVGRGRGGVVTVIGDIGLGKSRLLRESQRDTVVARLDVHAEPYGASSAYRMVRDPLREILGIRRDTTDGMGAALRSTVRRHAPHLEPLVPLVADVVQVDVDTTPEAESIAAEFRFDRTADVVIEMLAAIRPGPLVITAEDAHWADLASSHLLGRIAAETETRPWLLLVERRDVAGGFTTDRGITVPVAPLPPAVLRRLAIAATEAAPLRPHELDLVAERAAGSPLFVDELIALVREVGSLDAVPESLQGTLAAQVDALGPLPRRILSHASVLGRSFRRSIVEALLDREGLGLDSIALSELERFIEPDGPLRLRFRNGLVCDVVYDGLAYRVRARLHREAGHAMEEISDDLTADSDMLSLHFWRAGDDERTYRYALMAAERAERAHVNPDAAVHYERAVEAARRLPDVDDQQLLELWLALGDVRERAGLFHEALDAYRCASTLAGDEPMRAEIHLRRARVRERAGQFALALRECTRAGRLVADGATPGEAALRARALSLAALVRQNQEHARTALRLARSAADHAERCEEWSALAQALSVIAWAGLVLGRDDAVVDARRALGLYEQIGDLAGQANLSNNLGVLAYFAGDWDETLDLYGRSVDACRRIGNLIDAATTEANIGEVLVNQGRLDEAEEVLRDAARVQRASGFVVGAAFAEMHLGRLLTRRRALTEAERVLRAGVDEMMAVGRTASAYETSLHLASCLTRSGRPQEALEVIARAAAGTAEDTSILDASRAAVVADALIELGFNDEAVETIAVGVEHARRRHLEFDLARLLLLAERIGPPFDTRLGTTEPADEAHHVLDRLGVVGPVRP